MISLKELNSHNYPTTPEIDKNLTLLLERINKFRTIYDTPMIVTSGLRSEDQQQALIKTGKSNAPKSHHLTGEAVDILDVDGKLYAYVEANLPLLESIGLWYELGTKGWTHFQIVPPKSGHRGFYP